MRMLFFGLRRRRRLMPQTLGQILTVGAAVIWLTWGGASGAALADQPGPEDGWLAWRGPLQTGVSFEVDLPDAWRPGGENHLWTAPLRGRGAPVIRGDRLYTLGYHGETDDLIEVLACLDVATGETIWEKRFPDFLSDVIYNRYSIGSPAIDPETGAVYAITAPGMFVAVSADGEDLWSHSLMEKFGRLTFPNGRTGTPVVDGDLVIIHGIFSNWGAQGPARDRFYAFDKRTGELVWSSTPGAGPTDSSFSTPYLGWADGRRVLYAGTGCGYVVAVNARNGEPLWRYRMSVGGVNSAVVPFEDSLIAIHGKEDIRDARIGRMTRIPIGASPEPGAPGPVELPYDAALWHNELTMFTSSPVIVGDRVYQMTATGDLHAVDARTGASLWKMELGPSQLHSSPLYADGKLYILMQDGVFYIIRPGDEGGEVLTRVQLEGSGIGSPTVWNGRIFVPTTTELYCLGSQDVGTWNGPWHVDTTWPEPGTPARLMVIPEEVLLRPGDVTTLRLRIVDARGFVVDEARIDGPSNVTWSPLGPPAARLDASFDPRGRLIVGPDARASAGAFRAQAGQLAGAFRGRIVDALPIRENFETFRLTEQPSGGGEAFAHPTASWIGARMKWQVREMDGDKVLAKTLDNVLFQRSMVFLAHPRQRNYTLSADVMTDGNRRIRSTVGLINQRYAILLKGNHQVLEVTSNHERLKVSTPFPFEAGVWYRLKTRVDVLEDGGAVIRAKAWPRDEAEPESWTIEAPHRFAHTEGSPGLFGFTPQSKFSVYVDNIEVVFNDQ